MNSILIFFYMSLKIKFSCDSDSEKMGENPEISGENLQNFLIFREICSLASLEEWLTLCFFPFKGDGRGLMGLVSFQESPNYLLTWIS